MEYVALARGVLTVLDYLITKDEAAGNEPDPDLVQQRTDLRRALADAAKSRTSDGGED